MNKGKRREFQSEIIIVWQFLSYPVPSPGQELIQRTWCSWLSKTHPNLRPAGQLHGHWTGFLMLLCLCLWSSVFPECPFCTSIFSTQTPPFPGNLEHLNSLFNIHLKGYLAWCLPLPSPYPSLPYPIPPLVGRVKWNPRFLPSGVHVSLYGISLRVGRICEYDLSLLWLWQKGFCWCN